MRKVLLVCGVLLALPVLALLVLYISSPVVASRYISLFQPEDGNYKSLVPRAVVAGDSSHQLPVADTASQTIDPAALSAMAEFADQFDSYAMVVIHKGVVQTEWYADDWSAERLTQSQSMHKSLQPIMIQAAIEEGAISSVTDPVRFYLSEWQNDSRGEITIEQLMMMESGLYAPPFSLNPFSDDYLWLFGDDVTPILLSTPLVREPGAEWEYNDLNSEILGLIVERSTGRRYVDYLAEKLWVPMGGSGAELWLDAEGGKAHTSCCLMTPAMDWAKFGLLLLGRGNVNGQQVVSSEFIDQMITPLGNANWYGYQIWLANKGNDNPWRQLTRGYQRSEEFLADDVYYASGYGAQRVYVVPSQELVIVRLGPATGRQAIKPEWDNAYLVNTAIRNMR
jgi:CubicO group peptidase (beta-lactamase class C family)